MRVIGHTNTRDRQGNRTDETLLVAMSKDELANLLGFNSCFSAHAGKAVEEATKAQSFKTATDLVELSRWRAENKSALERMARELRNAAERLDSVGELNDLFPPKSAPSEESA